MRRVFLAVLVVVAGLAVLSETTPASATAATRCKRPCSTTTTAAPVASTTTTSTTTSTTSTTVAPTTTTTAAPATTTSTTAAPVTTTTTTAAPAQICSDGSTPLDSTTTSEGARVRICTTVGTWTAARIVDLLRANALDLDAVGPRLVVEVTTVRPSSTGSSASCCDASGNYYGFRSTMSLNPSSTSSFANAPDAVFAHEYGHAWTSYWLYTNPANAGSWAAYRNARWTTADGSQVLAQNSKLNTSYNWTDYEMAADDYRRLFGSAAAQAQLAYLNASVPDPQQVPGLAGFFLDTWR